MLYDRQVHFKHIYSIDILGKWATLTILLYQIFLCNKNVSIFRHWFYSNCLLWTEKKTSPINLCCTVYGLRRMCAFMTKFENWQIFCIKFDCCIKSMYMYNWGRRFIIYCFRLFIIFVLSILCEIHFSQQITCYQLK